MKREFLLILLLSFALKIPAQDSLLTIVSLNLQTKSLADGWKEVICYDANFKISIPGTFQLKSDTIQTDIGDLYLHTFYLQQKKIEAKGKATTGENLFFTLSIYDYPFSIHQDSTDLLADFLSTTVESATGGVGGELVYQSDISLNKYHGKIWRIHYNKGKNVIRSKAYLIKNRLYLLSVAVEKKYSLNIKTDRYFESFKFLE